jgi:hypothetical protein
MLKFESSSLKLTVDIIVSNQVEILGSGFYVGTTGCYNRLELSGLNRAAEII